MLRKMPKKNRFDVHAMAEHYRVLKPRDFRLADLDCGDTFGIRSKDKAQAQLAQGIERLADLQERLYAQDRWSLLLIFQAMDAAGKDSTIKHVMSGINPQGCQVYSFKRPSEEELDHDWLWRGLVRLPERGRIGIHNRSWYEEVLVVRVHPELLGRQKLPPAVVTKDVWKERYESINDVERHLARNGTAICKFFLHVSKGEQKQRFLERLKQEDKHWKFEPADVREREHWDAYMQAYEQAIRATSTKHAPWYVVPADHKWFLRLAVANAVIDTLERLDLKYPEIGELQQREFEECRRQLEGKSVADPDA